MTPDEYSSYDGLGLAELVRTKQITAGELADIASKRIADLNPALQAVVHSLEDRARDRVAAGLPDGPFTGVPTLLKDMLDLKGTRQSMGCAILADFESPKSHPLATRFEASGVVILGRTNMSELGLLPNTEPGLYPPTRNPWKPSHSPGGSSGGSAAAVASGMVPFAYAADGGGSIRIPASTTGLFGLKPSRGRHPRVAEDEPDGFVQHHVLTKTVRDSAAMLDFTCQRNALPTGRWWVPPPAQSYLAISRQDPAPMRIGFTTKGLFGERVHPHNVAAVERAAKRCEALGHHVEEVELPIDGEAFTEAFALLWTTVGGVFMNLVARELDQSKLPSAVARFLSTRPRALRAATRLPTKRGGPPLVGALLRRLASRDTRTQASDLWLAQIALQQTADALHDGVFSDHDLLLSSTLAKPPWPIGHLDRRMSDDDFAKELWGYIALAPLANASGMPACSVPMGLSPHKLPIGVQLLAPVACEDRLFAIAGQLEREGAWPMPGRA